jgi:hypothetical protein
MPRRLAQLPENVSSTSTPEWIARLTPFNRYVEDVSGAEALKCAHGFPGFVIVVCAFKTPREKLLNGFGTHNPKFINPFGGRAGRCREKDPL